MVTSCHYCKHYHVEVQLRQKNQARFFVKKFSLNFLSQIGFDMVMLTVNEEMVCLVAIGCTTTTVLCMSPVQH